MNSCRGPTGGTASGDRRKQAGRIEIRRLWSDAELGCYIREELGFPGARRPGLGEVFAALVNTGLNVLRLEGWFPSRMSMPLRTKTCAFRPEQGIARLSGRNRYVAR